MGWLNKTMNGLGIPLEPTTAAEVVPRRSSPFLAVPRRSSPFLAVPRRSSPSSPLPFERPRRSPFAVVLAA
jgi:hypothetical protein